MKFSDVLTDEPIISKKDTIKKSLEDLSVKDILNDIIENGSPKLNTEHKVTPLNISSSESKIINNTINNFKSEVLPDLIDDVNKKITNVIKERSLSTEETSLTISKINSDEDETTTDLSSKTNTYEINYEVPSILVNKIAETLTPISSELSSDAKEKLLSYSIDELKGATTEIKILPELKESLENKSRHFNLDNSLSYILKDTIDSTRKQVELKGENLLNELIFSPINTVKNGLNIGSDFVLSSLNSGLEFVNGLTNNTLNGANNFLSENIGFDFLDYNLPTRSSFKDGIVMEDKSAWWMDIQPYYDFKRGLAKNNTPPNLHSFFNCEMLPITSFTINGESIQTMDFEFTGGSISAPKVYIRPSSMSIQLPEVYYNANGRFSSTNAVTAWKRKYIEYTFNGKPGGNKVRNFYECMYKVKLVKRRWKGDSRHYDFEYLVIPVNITTGITGTETNSSGGFDTIYFQILGDNYQENKWKNALQTAINRI